MWRNFGKCNKQNKNSKTGGQGIPHGEWQRFHNDLDGIREGRQDIHYRQRNRR